MIETVLDRSYLLAAEANSDTWYAYNNNYLGYWRQVQITFNSDDGEYFLVIFDSEIQALTNYDSGSWWNALAQYNNCCNEAATLPFPETWTLDEDGIQVDWYLNGWVANTEHFRLIPYWHEAE